MPAFIRAAHAHYATPARLQQQFLHTHWRPASVVVCNHLSLSWVLGQGIEDMPLAAACHLRF